MGTSSSITVKIDSRLTAPIKFFVCSQAENLARGNVFEEEAIPGMNSFSLCSGRSLLFSDFSIDIFKECDKFVEGSAGLHLYMVKTIPGEVSVRIYSGQRRNVKLINNSDHNITIIRRNGKPVVAIPKSYTESSNFCDLVSHLGTHLNIRKCILMSDDTIKYLYNFEADGITFACVDADTATVKVIASRVVGG